MAEEEKNQRRTTPTSEKLKEAEKQKELKDLKDTNAKYAEEYAAKKTVSYVEQDENGNDRTVQVEGKEAFRKILENDQRIDKLEGVKFKDQTSTTFLGKILRGLLKKVASFFNMLAEMVSTIHIPVYDTKAYQEALAQMQKTAQKEATTPPQQTQTQGQNQKGTQETVIDQFDGQPISAELKIPIRGKVPEVIENKNILNTVKERWEQSQEQSQNVPESDKHSEFYLINQRRRQVSNEIITQSKNKSRNVNKAINDILNNRNNLSNMSKDEYNDYIKNKEYRNEDFRYVDFDLITNKKIKDEIAKEIKTSNKAAVYFMANPKLPMYGKADENGRIPVANAVLDRKGAAEYVVKEYLAKWYVENPTYAQFLIPNQVSDDIVHELIAQNPDIINHLTEQQIEEFNVKDEKGMINIAIVENIVKKFPNEQIDEVKIMMSTTPNGAALVEAVDAVINRNKELTAVQVAQQATEHPEEQVGEQTTGQEQGEETPTGQPVEVPEDVQQLMNDVINEDNEEDIKRAAAAEEISKAFEMTEAKSNEEVTPEVTSGPEVTSETSEITTQVDEVPVETSETTVEVVTVENVEPESNDTTAKDTQNTVSQPEVEYDTVITNTAKKSPSQNIITQEQREEMKKKTNEMIHGKYKTKETTRPELSSSLGDLFNFSKLANAEEQER